MTEHTNRLAEETSPYLLQHAENPVDWHGWNSEALATAREQNKPILLSIGYSACHWCHVMAHESFEDPKTAEVMNRLFINIKVDREERPDILSYSGPINVLFPELICEIRCDVELMRFTAIEQANSEAIERVVVNIRNVKAAVLVETKQLRLETGQMQLRAEDVKVLVIDGIIQLETFEQEDVCGYRCCSPINSGALPRATGVVPPDRTEYSLVAEVHLEATCLHAGTAGPETIDAPVGLVNVHVVAVDELTRPARGIAQATAVLELDERTDILLYAAKYPDAGAQVRSGF